MQGLMQDCPLLISTLIQHADRHHGAVEIVSRRIEGDLHRTTYRQLHARAKQLAKALDESALLAAVQESGQRTWDGVSSWNWQHATVDQLSPMSYPIAE